MSDIKFNTKIDDIAIYVLRNWKGESLVTTTHNCNNFKSWNMCDFNNRKQALVMKNDTDLPLLPMCSQEFLQLPYSIIVEVKELFGSESKTQLYVHLHELVLKPSMHSIGTVWSKCHLYFRQME